MLEKSYFDNLLRYNTETPCFMTDIKLLKHNAAILDSVQKKSGAKVLLALKGFSQWNTFFCLSKAKEGVLNGCCASSPDEAKLAYEKFGGEVHAFAAAFSEKDIYEILPITDHISFNSFNQWNSFKSIILKHNETATNIISCGLRINPEHSEGAVEIYNPCAPGSRLGIRLKDFEGKDLSNIEGLHFHTLCEQGADALFRTLEVVERNFGKYFSNIKWLNMGGGHHITKSGYDIDLLCSCISRIKDKYGLEVYLEPGEAVALNAGFLVASVLDIVKADMDIAILDISATCHMPDVLEMPYRPHIIDSANINEKKYSYRFAGKSCLAGDIIGEYSFDTKLEIGSKLIFTDMAIYSMVKTSNFNGLQLPSIIAFDSEKGEIVAQKDFTYSEFASRLS